MPDKPEEDVDLAKNHFDKVNEFLKSIENQYENAPFPKLIFPGSFFVSHQISTAYKKKFVEKIKELKIKAFPIEIKFDIRMINNKNTNDIKDDLVLIPANQVESPEIVHIFSQNNKIDSHKLIDRFNQTFREAFVKGFDNDFKMHKKLYNPQSAQRALDNGDIHPKLKYDYIYAIELTQNPPVIYIPSNITDINSLKNFLGSNGYLDDQGNNPKYLLHLKIGERTMGIEKISDDAVLTDFLSTERAIEHQTEESSKLYCEIENFIMKHFNTRQKLGKNNSFFEKPFDETGTYILSFLLYCTVIFAALKGLYNWSQGLNSWALFNTAEHILNDKIDKLNQLISTLAIYAAKAS